MVDPLSNIRNKVKSYPTVVIFFIAFVLLLVIYVAFRYYKLVKFENSELNDLIKYINNY